MEYVVIEDSNLQHFEDRVNRYLNSGWRPTGGVSHIQLGSGLLTRKIYNQALIKEEPKDED